MSVWCVCSKILITNYLIGSLNYDDLLCLKERNSFPMVGHSRLTINCLNILIASRSEAYQWCLLGSLERTPTGILVGIFIPENSVGPECQSTSVFPAIFYTLTAQDHSDQVLAYRGVLIIYGKTGSRCIGLTSLHATEARHIEQLVRV